MELEKLKQAAGYFPVGLQPQRSVGAARGLSWSFAGVANGIGHNVLTDDKVNNFS